MHRRAGSSNGRKQRMGNVIFPQLTLIVAVARNGIIGTTNEDGRGALPWHLPEDLKHFKETTSGHPIIMGRKTWESLGRPLPNRRNIVITRQADYVAPGAEVFGGLAEALMATVNNKTFVIGGAELYRQALPLAATLIITEVDLDAEGDTLFPTIDTQVWTEADRVSHVSATGLPYAFVRYMRRGP